MITWSSNEAVFGSVMYAANWPFLYANAASVSSASGFNVSQAATIIGLQAHTTYYFVLVSTDAAGNLSYTIDRSFQTQ